MTQTGIATTQEPLVGAGGPLLQRGRQVLLYRREVDEVAAIVVEHCLAVHGELDVPKTLEDACNAVLEMIGEAGLKVHAMHSWTTNVKEIFLQEDFCYIMIEEAPIEVPEISAAA
jgi:hypothetical protein